MRIQDSLYKKTCPFLLFIVVFLIFGISLSAQSTLVTLEGNVTDEEATFLPGVSISVKNIETGFEYSGLTRSDGRYVISGIQPGNYEMEVVLSGFATQKRGGLTFNIGARLAIDFVLKPAALTEEVSVTAESPMVEISKSEISAVVDRRKIDDLPLLDRNYTNLTLLKAGVQEGMRASGMPRAMGQMLIDGVSNTVVPDNSPRMAIPADAIQEFRVVTNQFEAEYGNAAGLLQSAITRSGSNDFRGRASFFYRDEALDSVNYFVNHAEYKGPKLPKDQQEESPYSHYRYGGFLGGPIKKDKAHFFLVYEGLNRKEYATVTSPLVSRETVEVPSTNNQVLFKMDYQLNEKNLFTFRYGLDYPVNKNQMVGGLYTKERAEDINQYNHDFQANWTFFPSDNSMNELRLLATSLKATTTVPDPGAFTIDRPSGFFGKGSESPQDFTDRRYQIVDNFSLFLGNHTLKMGIDYSRILIKGKIDFFIPGQFIFLTDDPFDPADPFTYPFIFLHNTGNTAINTPYDCFGIFMQDSWQIHPRLTLNYGLRYSYYATPGLDLDNANIRNFNPRFGFSWDPVGDRKTSLRGGIGTYTANPLWNASGFIHYISQLRLEMIIFPNYPDPYQPNPFFPPMQGSVSLGEYGAIENQVAPYSVQTTLGFEREVIPNLAVSADLVWVKGYRQMRIENYNPVIPGTEFERKDPERGDMNIYTDRAKSDYKALYFTLKKRYADGWSFEVSYTLSKSMSHTDQEDFPDSYEADNWDRQYGPTNTDARHRLAATGIVDLPLGFQLSALLYYRSALPWNALYVEDVNLDSLNSDYVDRYKNSRRGFDELYLNARISKYFNIDRFNLQLFAELYNVTNRTNFRDVFNRFGLPGFGEPTAAGEPRLIQFGVRLDF